jgi:dihydroflavonol-4-reductase
VRVLVTGAAGFIGGHVVAALVNSGAQVRALVREPSRHGVLPDDVELFRGDVLDADAVRLAMHDCEAVFHLAAVYSYARRDVGRMRAVNIEGTRTVLDAAVRGRRRRIVHTSTCATCGPAPGRLATELDLPPASEFGIPYKRTKLAGEHVALSAAREGVDVVIVNPTIPVGAGDHKPTPTGQMVADVALGKARAYLAGSVLNVVGVEDVASGHLAAYEQGRAGERYLLGGENLSIREVFAVIARAAGLTPPVVPVPWAVAFTAACATDAMLRPLGRESQLLAPAEVRSGRLPHAFDDSRARRELGYRSRPAADALTLAALAALETDRSANRPSASGQVRRQRGLLRRPGMAARPTGSSGWRPG